MSFVSIEFALVALFFFPLYWMLRPYRRLQMFFLMASGYGFYATWSLDAVAMLLGFSVYEWLAGRVIRMGAGDRAPRLRLALGLLLTVSVLLYFKYYEFLRQALSDMLQNFGLHAFLPVLDILAPIGISFFVFQAVTFLVWQAQAQSRTASVAEVLLYLGFWPTHFAGPIFRADDFFRQLDGAAVGAPIQVERAIYIILLGLAQKLVFANWLEGTFVADAFKYPDTQTAISSVAAVLGYSLQIFFDFSGYTLIVTGLGLLLGFELPLNFRQPYLATSLRDFWRRWHISLSTFIRDYIYIPLGGNRRGYLHAQFNLMVAMVLSGLWHGANFTFVFWGFLHGAGVAAQNIFEKLFGKGRLPGLLAHLLTLLYVGFAWAFFRADSRESAWALVSGLGRGMGTFSMQHAYLLLFAAVFYFLSRHAEIIERAVVDLIGRYRGLPLVLAATSAMFLIILLGPSGVPGFIYYQF
ncbi:MAG TPA: MBOAT family O-acyltransferase [Gallionellaceae bacterium]|nr:MBOAT family O-acyltransferase [Gallionellaceae bacterium]